MVEAPTYDRTLLALRELGAEILAIPLEADGIDVDALEIALSEGARPTLAHIIPNFQNPAGCTLSLEKRRKLLASRRARLHHLRGRPLRRAAIRGRIPPHDAVDGRAGSRHLRVVLLEDGLPRDPGRLSGRTGGRDRRHPQAGHEHLHLTEHGRPVDRGRVLRLGRDRRSIETVKEALRDRRDATAEALERHIPDATFVKPEGGYFLWVDLPEGSDVAALAARAEERGVVFVKGSDFLIEGGDSSLRIAYSAVPPDQIEEAVARVAEAYRELAGAAA